MSLNIRLAPKKDNGPEPGKSMPMDYVRLLMERRVRVQVDEKRDLYGILDAYDEHLNIILSDVQEKLYSTNEDGSFSCHERKIDLLYVHGIRVISISPIE